MIHTLKHSIVCAIDRMLFDYDMGASKMSEEEVKKLISRRDALERELVSGYEQQLLPTADSVVSQNK